MAKKALILAANGTEEAELVIVADLLVRAEVRDLDRLFWMFEIAFLSSQKSVEDWKAGWVTQQHLSYFVLSKKGSFRSK